VTLGLALLSSLVFSPAYAAHGAQFTRGQAAMSLTALNLSLTPINVSVGQLRQIEDLVDATTRLAPHIHTYAADPAAGLRGA